MKYKFKLTTKSMLLTSSGEGSVLIDSDVVFHPTGFPFIPAKRIKGMLRESMEEVMEIQGSSETDKDSLINSLFGESGKQTYEGKLLFRNLFIQDWMQVCEAVVNKPQPAFHPDFVKAYFTTEIQQTAIGKDEIAKDKSLRNYRVINPGHLFEASIMAIKGLSSNEWDCFKKAVKNLRYAGTRRNRGFGKISCEILEDKAPIPPKANAEVLNASEVGQLSIEITTISPVVLAQQLGEQNTVFTSRFISGSQVRGILANAYIRAKNLDRSNAHLDLIFYNVFLSGDVKFGNLNFKDGTLIPMHIQEFKADKSKAPINTYANDSEVTRPINQLGKVKNGTVLKKGLTPQTTLFFHNSRKNRSAGRSTKNEGSIFYYESIDENQSFSGKITGTPDLITLLKNAFPSKFPERLGRSKSVQYGEVEISLNSTSTRSGPSIEYPSGKYLLILKSPLVLFNEYGLPEPSKETLLTALSVILDSNPVVENAAATTTMVEQFNASWLSKSGKCHAYKEGSSFLIELTDVVKLPAPLEFLGEWNEQGYGKLTFEAYDNSSIYSRETDIADDHSNAPDQAMSSLELTGVQILDEITACYNNEIAIVRSKTKAIKEANAAQYTSVLKNHLIGRMERLFENSQTPEEIQGWISNCFKNNAASKPAGEALQKAGLVNDRNEFLLKKSGEESFALQKAYWITFFQTLRKKNKSNGRI